MQVFNARNLSIVELRRGDDVHGHGVLLLEASNVPPKWQEGGPRKCPYAEVALEGSIVIIGHRIVPCCCCCLGPFAVV